MQNYTKMDKLPSKLSLIHYFNGQSHDVKERLATVAIHAPVTYSHFGKTVSGSAHPLFKYHGCQGALRRLYYSAQRCASHSLRFTKPFNTLPPAYTHLRNCSCMSSVDAPAFILRSSVDDFRLPRPRL